MSKSSMLLAGAMLLLSACGLEAQPNYTVTLPVGDSYNNTMAYLIDWDSAQKMDSTIITDGVIKFTGHVDAPILASMTINGQRGPVFFVEEGDIDLSGNAETRYATPLNKKLAANQQRMSEIAKEYRALDQNDSIQAAKGAELIAEYDAIPSKAYEDNKDNMYGVYMYLQAANEYPLSQIESDMAANPLLASSKKARALVKTLKVQAETGEGKHYKDFTVEYDGKKEAFSSYVKPGRYTIVDFWASWCGPCVRQLKVIKELYSRFKDQGLDVVGVAVWDKPEDTVEAIKRHELPWPCIINAQSVPTDLYGIQGIPCILLINPEGIIVSRDKQGAELIDAVEKAMATYTPQTEAF